jgi:hypothetical protein
VAQGDPRGPGEAWESLGGLGAHWEERAPRGVRKGQRRSKTERKGKKKQNYNYFLSIMKKGISYGWFGNPFNSFDYQFMQVCLKNRMNCILIELSLCSIFNNGRAIERVQKA